MLFTNLPVLSLLSIALAAPTSLSTRATAQCGQYQQQTSGAYSMPFLRKDIKLQLIHHSALHQRLGVVLRHRLAMLSNR
jgi:hypothetical protein